MRYLTFLPVLLILATSCVQEDLSEFVPANELEQPAPPVVVDPYGDDTAQDDETATDYTGEYRETEQVSEAEARQDEARTIKNINSLSASSGTKQLDVSIPEKKEPTQFASPEEERAYEESLLRDDVDRRLDPVEGEKETGEKTAKTKG